MEKIKNKLKEIRKLAEKIDSSNPFEVNLDLLEIIDLCKNKHELIENKI